MHVCNKVLPDDTDFGELPETPCKACVHAVVSRDGSISTIPKTPDVPKGNVPVKAARQVQGGANLRLDLRRVVLVFHEVGVVAPQMNGTQAGADFPPPGHSPRAER